MPAPGPRVISRHPGPALTACRGCQGCALTRKFLNGSERSLTSPENAKTLIKIIILPLMLIPLSLFIGVSTSAIGFSAWPLIVPVFAVLIFTWSRFQVCWWIAVRIPSGWVFHALDCWGGGLAKYSFQAIKIFSRDLQASSPTWLELSLSSKA